MTKSAKNYLKVVKVALKYKWVYIVLLTVSIILVVCDLAFAETSRTLFDLAPFVGSDKAIIIIISFIVIIIIQFILRFVNSCLHSYLNESIVYEMRKSLLSKVQHLPIKFFDLNHSSTVHSIFFNQLESVKHFVVYDILNLIMLPITFVLVGIYLFTVHPYLAITALLSSILQLLSNLTFKKSLNNAIDNQRKVTRDVFHIMGETMQGIREVKINQVEDFVDGKMQDCQARGVKHNLILTKYRTIRNFIKDIPMKVGFVFGIAVGIYLMADGKINPGGLIVFITLLGKVSEPFDGIVRAYVNYQESSRHAQELLILMNESEENYKNGIALDNRVDSIKFENVSFKYTLHSQNNIQNKDLVLPSKITDVLTNTIQDDYILDKINFTINGGQTIALVGPSGSGKSTIVKLLYRFYDINEGVIKINDMPLDDYSINSLRGNMSIVSQDMFIFDGTIYDNIVLGRKSVTDEELLSALKFSQSYDFVQKLPDGINTKLGERGIRLSHGQRQRISIARAIIKKAGILILDEPTSALDVDTEAYFQENLNKWASECTKIVIAHRFTTIRDCDYVLFLDDGKIIEQGSPRDLINQNGRFKEFWEKQFSFQDDNKSNT